MSRENLDNLARVGQLKSEPSSEQEIAGLIGSGLSRLIVAENVELSLESRFDLAYNAAHASSLAALRRHGYRPTSCYLVFQCLQRTVELPAEQWRVLDQAHRKRNLAEYEGDIYVDEQLVNAVVRVAREIGIRLASQHDVQASWYVHADGRRGHCGNFAELGFTPCRQAPDLQRAPRGFV